MKNNVMILTLMFGCMWCSGCEDETMKVEEELEVRPAYVAPELEVYLEEFIDLADTYNVPLDLDGFVLMLGTVSRLDNGGSCDGANGVVVIDREVYDLLLRACYRGTGRFEDWRLKVLIFHQLGHCLLGRDHRNDIGDDGFPVSIMHEHAIPILAERDLLESLYFEELFLNLNN